MFLFLLCVCLFKFVCFGDTGSIECHLNFHFISNVTPLLCPFWSYTMFPILVTYTHFQNTCNYNNKFLIYILCFFNCIIFLLYVGMFVMFWYQVRWILFVLHFMSDVTTMIMYILVTYSVILSYDYYFGCMQCYNICSL